MLVCRYYFWGAPFGTCALPRVGLDLDNWLETGCWRRDNSWGISPDAGRAARTDIEVAKLLAVCPQICMVFNRLARNASLDASRVWIVLLQPPEQVCIRPSQFPL